MAYKANDARNRSQVYKEGGKVESHVSIGLKKTRQLRTALKSEIVKEIEKSEKGQESWEALNKEMDAVGATKYKDSRNISKKKKKK